MNKKNPFFSIVTVCYNASRTIERTFQSINEQSFKNFEHIVIDGLSTDSTLEIIQKYKNTLSYFISEKDNGLYDAMNKGLNVARGKYILFMHADDTFNSRDDLEFVFQEIKKNNEPIWLVGGAYFVNGKNEITRHVNYQTISLFRESIANIINHQAMYVQTEVHKKIVFQPYKYALDYDVNLKLWELWLSYFYE